MFSLTNTRRNPATKDWAFITEPAHLRSLAIRMGRHTVLLPWDNTSHDLYQTLKLDARQRRPFTADAVAFP